MQVRTPYRISFAGGGTDLLSYSTIYGGCVVGCAIDQHITLTLTDKGITNESSLRQGSGLGGSGAYHAGMFRLAHPDWDRAHIIEAVTEQEKLGQQDQTLSVLGGLRYAEFRTDGTWDTTRLEIPDWLNKCMAIYYMGDREKEGKTYLTGINESALHAQKHLTVRVVDAIEKKDFSLFIDLMLEAWEVKKDFRPDILTPHICDFEKHMYEKGVLAFKIGGAGGGGYAILFRYPDSTPIIGTPVTIDRAGQTLIKVD